MKCSQLLFGTISLGVVVLLYPTNSECQYLYHVKTAGYNLTMGWRSYKDLLLFNETIVDKQSGALSKDVRIPAESHKGDYLISYFEVENKSRGGYVNLTGGGEGCAFVNLHLKSQEGEGFDFRVSIYGYKFD